MIAVLGGLGAAAAFAAAALSASRAARMIGAAPVLAWVMVVGFVIVLPWVALAGVPDDLDATALAWIAVSGIGNVLGLLLAYSALRIGKVGVVTPILSTEGAIAAVIAVVAGEQLADGVGATLVVIAIGIGLAAGGRDTQAEADGRHRARVAAYALCAAVSFGASLYATARASADLSIAWAVMPARLAGVLLVTLPLVVTSRLRLTRNALPLVVTSGVAEVAGFTLYAVGSRHGIAVTAVLASQFAAIAAIAAYFLFGERLVPIQIAGAGAVVVGVAVLTVLQA
jgi:drug/metabolite transporter (DMT)-like permease